MTNYCENSKCQIGCATCLHYTLYPCPNKLLRICRRCEISDFGFYIEKKIELAKHYKFKCKIKPGNLKSFSTPD